MTARHARIITLVAILVALAVSAQAQTPEIDALRAQADQGYTSAQFTLGLMYANGRGVPLAVLFIELLGSSGDDKGVCNPGGPEISGSLHLTNRSRASRTSPRNSGRGIAPRWSAAHFFCKESSNRAVALANSSP